MLIVVVADVEREAMWSQVRPLTGEPRRRPRTGVEFVYELGRIGDADVVVAQVDQGAVTPGSAGPAMPDLLRLTGAVHVILTSICYGLKEDDARDHQQLGDVLVATELRAIGHFKMTEDQDGVPLRQERGGRPVVSTVLVKLIREARHGWRNTAAIHFGPIVSESVLCASRQHRERIKQANRRPSAARWRAPPSLLRPSGPACHGPWSRLSPTGAMTRTTGTSAWPPTTPPC